MLQAADANGDQLIERAEFDALATETFDWRDRNGDGVLDIADMSPAVRRLAERRDAEGADGGPRRRGRFGLDADENGQITRAEFAAGEAEVFARLDVDSDGVITSAELNDRNEARRERRRWWRAR